MTDPSFSTGSDPDPNPDVSTDVSIGGNVQDSEAALVAQVHEAQAAGRALRIQGTGSKAFYGNSCPAEAVLDCTGHRGVVAYEPSELAITARAGTSLLEIEHLLAEQSQQFPFEPPHFGDGTGSDDIGGGTLGGLVATGLSGPSRPYTGSVRDAVLGVRLLNGRGEVLHFGGQVMKNVAGYDLSRLMAGALGVLGVLLEVSLKVIPTPPATLTLVHECSLEAALQQLRRWARRPLPITASAWYQGRLMIRLSGSDEALAESHRLLGGTPLDVAESAWRVLRDQRHAFFLGDAPLWRLSVSPATPADALPGAEDQLIEWGGALRWLTGDQDVAQLRALAQAAGGHATLFRPGRGPMPADGVFNPLEPVVKRLHQQLKSAFDPQGILNPRRLYPDL
ncbi:glycolate oxidase subunit GlcE [Rhabdochromatium marinum]|uniref:glycolate oxidase subunit GlcE n=1 Tax=Rhabdochromatium marinum TaxID=48729 RepID=UPI001907E8BE|nr:glycolate oxidase subunit GlcE [Rhabdochromatium marinum]MBK1647881.1 glycolate oxidase subunit GlcE [Rhabdochromatium marinum]